MEFSVFFNELKIEDIYSNNAKKMLIEFKKCCETENDFIQLYELKNILEVVNIFNRLHTAYLDCSKGNLDPLFKEIEILSNLLEDNFISCYSYAYYFYVYLNYIYNFDKCQPNSPRGLEDFEIPEKIEWCNPNKFDYSKLNETTFGVKADNQNGLTKSFPNYKAFEFNKNKLIAYKSSKPYVIIPDTVSTICKSAFSGNKRIKMVIIPDSVRTIEDGAFEGCEGLNLVHLSKQIKVIPNKCFSGCKRLKYIIGENIVEVGEEAFNLCVSLKEINLDSLTVAHNKSFYGCVGLENFDFVCNLSYIGDYAFAGCMIVSLFLNDCNYLGTNAFAGCFKLKEVIINNDIDNVGETPLFCCSDISHLEIRDAISFRVFDLFASSMEEYDGSDYKLSSIKLATLSPFICWNMKNLKEVEITGKTTVIPNNAFQNCENLTNIKFKDTMINEINDYAFENCISLISLNINYYGKSIGDSAFYNCSSINDFGFLNNVVSFGDKSLAYTNLTNFDFFNRKFEFIGKFAFANSYFPEDLNIHLDGTIVSAGAFHGAENINCLEIFNCDVDKELLYALFERTKEEFTSNVTILSLITDYTASPYLFSGFNSSFIECNLEGNEVPEGLFINCTSLCSVRLNGTITAFGAKSFMGCSHLDFIDTEVESDINVYEYAFMNCSEYEYPYFEQTRVIEDYAFYGSKITKLELTDKVSHIGDCAFGKCNISHVVKLPFVGNELNSDQPFGTIFAHEMVENSEVQLVNEKKYYIPKNIERLVITSESVRDNAFMNCYFIKKIDLPNVISITSPIFNNCSSLIEITFGSKLEEFNAISLFGVNKDIKINIDNNDKFVVNNSSIYSRDLRTIYYASNNNILDTVEIYKSYSVMNITLDKLDFNGIHKIENNAFDIKSIKKISINNVEYIASSAFMNSDNLEEICISSDSYNEYDRIFTIQNNNVFVSSMSLDNISVKSIRGFFKNGQEISIANLSILNNELEDSTFDGLEVSMLSLTNCSGKTNVNPSIKNILCNKCEPFNSMFMGDNKYNEISIITDELTDEEVSGVKCNVLNIKEAAVIKTYSFKNSIIDTLNIYGVDTIDKGVFYKCDIDNINIFDSPYFCEENCIYKDDQLLYYKPHKRNAKIPASIKNVFSYSVDLSNADSLEINGEVYFEEHAIYSSDNVSRLLCNKSNLTRISDLFDDASSIKELTYEGDEIPNKYLSNLTGVEKIILKSTINTIGDFAFSQNTSLKQIVNFERANIYGDFVLMNCSSLDRITFNEDAKSVGYHLIEGCSNLKSIEIPLLDYYYDFQDNINDILGENLSNPNIVISKGNIPENMFAGVTNSIEIRQSPVKIGNCAFEDVSNLSIKLINTKYIGDNAFKNSILSRVLELKECEHIGDNAFANCKDIKEIHLFGKIMHIGDNAFGGTQLEKLSVKDNSKYYVEQNCLFENNDILFYIPNSKEFAITINKCVDRIRRNAFTNCINLRTAVFNQVKKYDNYSFNNCSNLVYVDLGRVTSEIDGFVFVDCNRVIDLSIYQIKQGKNNCLNDYFTNSEHSDFNTVRKLKLYSTVLTERELDCNNSITEIELNDNVKNIPDRYFTKCEQLTTINIPISCESIGVEAFSGCKMLSTIDTYNSKVKVYGDRAFANTSIKNIEFNKNVTSLGSALFMNSPIESVVFDLEMKEFNCNNLSIGNTLKDIAFNAVSFAKCAFENKTQLISVKVNKYLGEEIPTKCFSNCTSLSNIVIPETYNVIKTNAYANCNALKRIEVKSHISIENNAFSGCNNVIEFIYDPHSEDFKLEFFGFANESLIKVVEVKDSILASSAFENYSNIQEIKVHRKQESIPVNCFKNCSSLSSIIIDGYKLISKSAFEGCGKLSAFDFKTCEKIETDSFKNCSSIQSIKIPATVKSLGKAFTGCSNVETITFENEISTFKISDYGFVPSDNLKEAFLVNNSLAIGAFAGYYNIKNVRFAKQLISVPRKCFEGCTRLSLQPEYINSLEVIDENAFASCDSLYELKLSNIKSIGKNAFENCKRLKRIAFGNDLKVIPESVCEGCSKLTEVSFSNELERIDKYAFSRTKIKKLDIYETIKYVDSMIFKDNDSSVKVLVPYKNYDTSVWAKDWNLGFAIKHKFFKFMNPKVEMKARR